MNSIKRFKNLMSILMLYATNMIVHDRIVIPEKPIVVDINRRITGTTFPKLTTTEKS